MHTDYKKQFRKKQKVKIPVYSFHKFNFGLLNYTYLTMLQTLNTSGL